jgi:allantoicase
MWDGWETKRRRGPGHDWASFKLGLPGHIDSAEVDTRHFKGNAPGWVSIHISDEGADWQEVARMAEVAPNTVNTVPLGGVDAGFIRLDIHPDGGVARLRVWGTPNPETAGSRRLEYLNSIFDVEARSFFATACAATTWVESMMVARPLPSMESVFAASLASFEQMGEGDWLEAFASHPRIGQRGDSLANSEQAGTAEAPDPILRDLSEINQVYEERHGFTYIVYATGKTAEEMLEIARERLGNSREREIEIASEQQRTITETRLRRMLCVGARR